MSRKCKNYDLRRTRKRLKQRGFAVVGNSANSAQPTRSEENRQNVQKNNIFSCMKTNSNHRTLVLTSAETCDRMCKLLEIR